MDPFDWYVPVARGWGFRFECECGAVGYTHFADDGLVPDLADPRWGQFGWACPLQWGMFARRFTLRDDNEWPALVPNPLPGLGHRMMVTISEVPYCPPSPFVWRKLPADELARLYAADSHHFNVVALEGAVLGLRPA